MMTDTKIVVKEKQIVIHFSAAQLLLLIAVIFLYLTSVNYTLGIRYHNISKSIPFCLSYFFAAMRL